MVCPVACFDVSSRPVYLTYMFVQIILGSVKVAVWPPFGNQLLPPFTLCSLCNMSICCFIYFPFSF